MRFPEKLKVTLTPVHPLQLNWGIVNVQFISTLPWVRFACVSLNLKPVLGMGELSIVLFTELRYVSEVPVKLEEGNSRGGVAEAVVYRFAWEYV